MRVRSNLSVTLGLRYDYTLLPKPQTANPLLDAEIAAIGGPIHGATGTFPEDRNNFGPRVAVVWSPRTVWGLPARWTPKSGQTVHGAAGVWRVLQPYSGSDGAGGAGGYGAALRRRPHVRIRPTTITDCPQMTAVQQGFGYPCDYTTAPPAAVAQTTFGDGVCERLPSADGAAWGRSRWSECWGIGRVCG